MASLLKQVEEALLRRAVEETAERAMREQSATGSTDGNAIARRFYRLLYADDSPIKRLIQNLPGARYAPHLALTLGAEYLHQKAETIFPGDNRPIVHSLRSILRYAAPALEGIGDAASDVMETQIDSAVNRVKSSTSAATPESGLLDLVRVWFVDGKAYPIIPIIGHDGRVQVDSHGDPIPSNLTAALMSRWLSDEFTRGKTRQVKNKDGKGTHDVSVPPTKRDLTNDEIGLAAALELIGGSEGLTPDQLDRIERLRQPKPSWESLISPDVDRVLSWLIDVLSLEALRLTALERQEIEDLVSKMKTQKPDPDWVNRRLGRFREETDRFLPNGRRTYDAAALGRIRILLSRIRDEIDITLEGEQSLATKARKGLQAAPNILRQMRDMLKNSAPWVIWVLLLWCSAILAAFVLLLLGILLPVAKFESHGFTMFAFICAITGGIIGFAITWPFPIIQKVYDYLQTLISSGNTVDSINSLGRRIASFALCIGAGVLPLTIWFEFPVLVRAGIVAFGGLFPIGVMFALREAGYPDLARSMVKRSLLIANFVFGTLAVATMALVGFIASYTGKFMTGPQFLKWAVNGSARGAGHAGSWLAGLHWWHYLGFGVLIVFALFVVAIFFGRSKGEKGGGDRAMTLASILLGGGAFLAVLFIGGWMVLAGLHEIGSWFHDDPAPITTTVVTQPQDNGSWFNKMELCRNPNTTFEQRQILKCP